MDNFSRLSKQDRRKPLRSSFFIKIPTASFEPLARDFGVVERLFVGISRIATTSSKPASRSGNKRLRFERDTGVARSTKSAPNKILEVVR
jgi:hypothetical protein